MRRQPAQYLTTLYDVVATLQEVCGRDDALVVWKVTQALRHGRAAFLYTRARVVWEAAPLPQAIGEQCPRR